MQFLTFLISVAIGGLAYGFRRKTGTWTHPAVVFGLFWFLMTLLPIIGVPELTASPIALTYIFAIVLAFGIPVYFTDWQPAVAIALSRRERPVSAFSGRTLLAAFLFLQTLPLLFICINLELQGFSLTSLVKDPLAVGCRYLGARYNGEIQPTLVSRAGTILNYVGAPIGGLIVTARRGLLFRAGVVLLSFLPSILSMILYADKGTVFLTAAFFYGAVIVGRIAVGNLVLLNWTTVLACLVGVAFLVPVMFVVLLNRDGASCDKSGGRTTWIMEKLKNVVTSGNSAPVPSTNQTTDDAPHSTETVAPDALTITESITPEVVPDEHSARSEALYTVRSYAFAHLFAFSDWFDHYYGRKSKFSYVDPDGLTYGFWTFMAIGKYVDPSYAEKLPDGYFGEYFSEGNIIKSNIYTIFRGLNYDFGLIGSLIFMGFFGLTSSISYKNILVEKYSPLSSSFYIFLFGYVYTSYIISLFIWNSIFVSFFAFLIIMIFLNKYSEKKVLESVI